MHILLMTNSKIWMLTADVVAHTWKSRTWALMTGTSGVQGHPGVWTEKPSGITVQAVSNQTKWNWKRKEENQKETWILFSQILRVILGMILTTAVITLV